MILQKESILLRGAAILFLNLFSTISLSKLEEEEEDELEEENFAAVIGNGKVPSATCLILSSSELLDEEENIWD